MKNILRHTKVVYQSYQEVNGKYKLNPTSYLGKRKLDNSTNNFLRHYLEFVMNSKKLISDITKIYITSMDDRPTDIVSAYNGSGLKEKITVKQLSNHMYYDAKRLGSLFPDDMLYNVMHGKGDLTKYEVLLENAVIQMQGETLLSRNCVLKLPIGISSEKPTELELDSFFMLFAPYTKKIIGSVEEQLPRQVVRYLNYLSCKKTLTEEEQAIMGRLNSIIEDELLDF